MSTTKRSTDRYAPVPAKIPDWATVITNVEYVGTFSASGKLYRVKINADARGYRTIVALWDVLDMPSTFNRKSTLQEKQGLLAVAAMIHEAWSLLGLETQVYVAGNNSHTFDEKTRQFTIGAKEVNQCHCHTVCRGDPAREYVSGVPLRGPVPGPEFSMRGDQKGCAGNDAKVKYPDTKQTEAVANCLSNLLQCVNARNPTSFARLMHTRIEREQTARYIANWYPEELLSKKTPGVVLAFQERAREAAALAFRADDPDTHTGWTALRIMQAMMIEHQWASQLPPEYHDWAVKQMADCKYPNNVRATVKRLWMWPQQGYLPWRDVPVDSAPGKVVREACAGIIQDGVLYGLRLVDGKLYWTMTGFVHALFGDVTAARAVSQLLPECTLRPNFETSHITLVNSDVVARFKMEDIKAFVAKYSKQMADLSVTKLAHTVSLDWARFSVCLTAHLRSEMLTRLINDFNITFGTTLPVPAMHITLAVLPRALVA